jgi:hypothetical protein
MQISTDRLVHQIDMRLGIVRARVSRDFHPIGTFPADLRARAPLHNRLSAFADPLLCGLFGDIPTACLYPLVPNAAGRLAQDVRNLTPESAACGG